MCNREDFCISQEIIIFALILVCNHMMNDIRIEDYNYDLPDHRIAKYPLKERDGSKLLQYKNTEVSE